MKRLRGRPISKPVNIARDRTCTFYIKERYRSIIAEYKMLAKSNNISLGEIICPALENALLSDVKIEIETND